MVGDGDRRTKAAGEETMNEKQWSLVAEFMELSLRLLQKIEENTREEKIEESKSQVKGFGVDR